MTVASHQADLPAYLPGQEAVAVEFHFRQPAGTGGRLLHQAAQLRALIGWWHAAEGARCEGGGSLGVAPRFGCHGKRNIPDPYRVPGRQ